MFAAIFSLFAIVVQILTCVLFCLVSGYVMTVGRSRTGMNFDYAFFAFMCGVVFVAL